MAEFLEGGVQAVEVFTDGRGCANAEQLEAVVPSLDETENSGRVGGVDSPVAYPPCLVAHRDHFEELVVHYRH